MNKPTQVTTNEVRISYEHLTKPYAQKLGEPEKYSATLLIPKHDFATKQRIDAAIQAAIQEGIPGKWGGVRPPQVPIPIHDGDGQRVNGEAFGPECRGHWVVTASSKQRQEIVDTSMNPIIDATQIYSGMYANVSINFFAYFNSGKKGIGCGLGPVQKTRDGEPLGGRVTAAEAFGNGAPQQYAQPQPQAPVQQPPWEAPAQQYVQQAPAQPQQYAQPAAAPQQAPYQPAPAQQPAAAQQPAQPQINPITGQPVGGVMGL